MTVQIQRQQKADLNIYASQKQTFNSVKNRSILINRQSTDLAVNFFRAFFPKQSIRPDGRHDKIINPFDCFI